MKKLGILLFCLFYCFPLVSLHSIYLTNEVINVGMYSSFAQGMFPTNVEVKYALPGLSLIPGNSTGLSFSLNAGYTGRTLTQDPQTGKYLYWHIPSEISDILGTDYPVKVSSYSVLYSSWSMKFSQGLGYSPVTKGDLVTLWASYDGQWEQAMERLLVSQDPLADKMFTYIDNQTITTRPIFQGNLIGTPDLQGNRYMLSTSLKMGLSLDLKRSTSVTEDGISANLSATFAPWWLLNDLDMFGGKSDYWKLSFTLYAGYTFYQLKQPNGWNWFSLVFYDELNYRYLDGPKVPKFAESGGLWGVGPQNLNHNLTNTMRLYLYGPQFIAADCYPYMYLFLDLGYSGGYLNNTNHQTSYDYFMGSVGINFHLRLFGIFHMYYDVGYVFGPERGKDRRDTWPGSFGFYISL